MIWPSCAESAVKHQQINGPSDACLDFIRETWSACFRLGSGKTAAFLVPILAQIYTTGPLNNAPKPAVSFNYVF